MKVLGVGFGRTGTSSISGALRQLGFGPCLHMFDIIGDERQSRRWLAAFENGVDDWDSLLAGYNSTMDWPGSFFWRDLITTYPEAKVILTRRDEDAWLTSFSNTLLPIWKNVRQSKFDEFPDHMQTTARMIQRLANGVFGPLLDDSEKMKAAYNQHNADVVDAVEANRLLVFDAKQGWDPLCEFLEVPVPDTDFPHVNDTRSFLETVSSLTAARR
ncbi:MAG: hypothetical protein J2P18_08110 [Nocardia sp.]|nr:hypothetical protein [Nocardia sp.]